MVFTFNLPINAFSKGYVNYPMFSYEVVISVIKIMAFEGEFHVLTIFNS